MKSDIILLLSIAIFGTIVSASTPQLPEVEQKTSRVPLIRPITSVPPTDATHKTTEVSTTTTTTTEPVTSSSTSSSTTAEPTTSAAPTTTTAVITTTTTTPSTTTAVPDTTTTSTTTAAPPIPTPEPFVGKWNLTDGTNTCIIVQLAMQLNLTYLTTENISTNALYNVPANLSTVVTGTCGNETEEQTIVVGWGPRSSQSSFVIVFSLNSTTHEYSLREIKFALNTNDLPKGKNETLTLWYANEFFSVPKGMSYHCTKNQIFNLTEQENSNKTIAFARVSHLQMEAYHKGNNAQFSYAKDCDAIDTPDIVPIAVGCALIALVVVVLIAYLVGRRRAQARGYISM